MVVVVVGNCLGFGSGCFNEHLLLLTTVVRAWVRTTLSGLCGNFFLATWRISMAKRLNYTIGGVSGSVEARDDKLYDAFSSALKSRRAATAVTTGHAVEMSFKLETYAICPGCSNDVAGDARACSACMSIYYAVGSAVLGVRD